MPDESMAPQIPAGTWMHFSKTAKPVPGHGVLALLSGELFVRKLIILPGGEWVGEAKNSGYAPVRSRDGAKIVAVMLGVMSGAID